MKRNMAVSFFFTILIAGFFNYNIQFNTINKLTKPNCLFEKVEGFFSPKTFKKLTKEFTSISEAQNEKILNIRFASLLSVKKPLKSKIASAGSNQKESQQTGNRSTNSINWTHLSSANGQIPTPGPSEQTSCLILDVNQDGLNDFVIGGRGGGPAMTWFRRDQNGWTKYVIDNSSLSIEAGGAYSDIDGDGDLDIVMGQDYSGNHIWWWENPYPNYSPGTPWNRYTIKNSGPNKHHDQIFGDFDGDGVDEFVYWNQGSPGIFIAEIPSNPKQVTSWPSAKIYSGSGEGIAKADIDGDGKIDLLAGGKWFKHISGNVYNAYSISSSSKVRMAAGDLIIGGKPEVVVSPGDNPGRLKWYECTGDPTNQNSWVETDLLGHDIFNGHSLDIADFDNDGFPDIFCAEMRLSSNSDAKMWIFFGDGNGNFTQTTVATGYDNHETKIGDLDGDGDKDICGKPFDWQTPRIDIWLNDTASGSLSLDLWERHVIDSNKPWKAVFISAEDVDGDAQKDIVTGGWWYKNPGSPSGGWVRHDIGSPLKNMAALFDFDNDGDIDILGTEGQGSSTNDNFVWAQNDGSGNFTVFNNITQGDGDFLQGVAIGNFHSGTDYQVALSWHRGGKGVQMLDVPLDPVNTTWPWQRISTASQDECLSAGDIDSDGDLDLLLGTKWLENDNSSWILHSLSNYNADPDRNRLFDMNADGRLDAIVGFEAISSPGKLAWYEQGSSATGIWTEHLIATVIGPMSLDVADMDNDGDLDVIVGEHNLANPSQANLFIFENTDGQAGSWIQHLVYQGDEHHDGARVVDIDGDGDLDIISIGWGHDRVLLYENKATGGSSQTAPVIITHPHDVTVAEGQVATFAVVASGSPPLQYQWQKNGADITGATSSVYVTPPTTIADNGSKYKCLVSNSFGNTQSNEATLTVVQGGTGRVSRNLVSLYTFEEGSGNIIHDVSGVGSPLNLEINDLSSVSWDSNGLNILSPCQINSTGAADKIVDSCMATNEITIEAWLQTGNLNQTGPARIVTLSEDYYNRNFTLGQSASDYNVRLRTTVTGNNGTNPSLTASNTVSTNLCHFVYLRDAAGQTKIFIDGVQNVNGVVGGDFSNWNSSFKFGLANEISGGRPWLGKFYLVAIYNSALTDVEITQNYLSGPHILDAQKHKSGNAKVPGKIKLFQNYPNPFNPVTSIAFDIDKPRHVSLLILDVRGAVVDTLIAKNLPAGAHQIQWDAHNLASGIYFYRLEADNTVLTKKLLLVK